MVGTVAFALAFAFFKILNALKLLRVAREAELEGLDMPEMGALGYPKDFEPAPDAQNYSRKKSRVWAGRQHHRAATTSHQSRYRLCRICGQRLHWLVLTCCLPEMVMLAKMDSFPDPFAASHVASGIAVNALSAIVQGEAMQANVGLRVSFFNAFGNGMRPS